MYFAILFTMHSDGMFAVNQSHFPFVGKFGRELRCANEPHWRKQRQRIQMRAFPGTSRNCLSEANVWLVIVLTTVVCVVPSLTLRLLRADLCPTTTDKVIYPHKHFIHYYSYSTPTRCSWRRQLDVK